MPNLVKPKDLKQIVATEMQTQRDQQKKVEEQLENHKAHDSNVRLGAKVAAVAVGGVIVGALTAGIGLVPYITVVGLTAVAGGGAVALQYKRPSDSRLILACESMDEALSWKSAIESEVNRLEKFQKPMLPPTADARLISSILGMTAGGSGWHTTSVCEGMKLLEQSVPIQGSRCRKAQLVIKSTPVNTFLSLMESHYWPRGGSIKVDKVIDDHADIVTVKLATDCVGKNNPKHIVQREMSLCRFWKLDDDGVYLITFNTVKSQDNLQEKQKGINPVAEKDKPSKSNEPHKTSKVGPSFDAVITISPRRDHDEYDADLPVALVVCTCQVSTDGGWRKGELEAVMDDFLKQQLLDLRQSLLLNKFIYSAAEREARALSSKSESSLLPHSGKFEPIPILASIGKSRSRAMSPGRAPSDREVVTKSSSYERAASPGRSEWRAKALTTSKSMPVGSGITTTQPGAEEVSVGGPPSKDEKSRRHLFRRTFSKATTPSHITAAPGSTDQSAFSKVTGTPMSGRSTPDATTAAAIAVGAGSSESATATKPKNRFSSRRKSKTINPQASALRRHIAAKEYEVQRVEKMLKKQGASLAAAEGGTVTVTVPGRASEVDLASYQALLKELQGLKQEYQLMTGLAYEQSSRLSFGRLRSLGSRSNSSGFVTTNIKDANTTITINNEPESSSPTNLSLPFQDPTKSPRTTVASGAYTTGALLAYRERGGLPLHWQISR